MKKTKYNDASKFVLWASILLLGCEPGRRDGNLEVRLVNLYRDTGATALEVRIQGDGDTVTDVYQLDRLTLDSVSFPGLKPGIYTVVARSTDNEGTVFQEGLSPTLTVVEGEIVVAPTAMVSIRRDIPCAEDETVCEMLPGFDLVMGCEGGTLHPLENCGETMKCRDGRCVEGAPHVGPNPVSPEDAESYEVGINVCDPSMSGNRFSLEFTNPFFPLEVGSLRVLEGSDDENENMTVVLSVPDIPSVLVDGVETRVMEELESEDGILQQRTWSFFAAAEDGTVCYFGEEVWDIDDNRERRFEAASWLSDTANRIYPGIAMPADPAVGARFQQQVAPGISLDRGEIVGLGEPVETPAVSSEDTVWILETSLFDGNSALKVYVKGIGLVRDEGLTLVER